MGNGLTRRLGEVERRLERLTPPPPPVMFALWRTRSDGLMECQETREALTREQFREECPGAFTLTFDRPGDRFLEDEEDLLHDVQEVDDDPPPWAYDEGH